MRGVVAALALSCAATAGATEVVDPFDEPDESELYRLDEQLVTTASRYAQAARKAPSIITVVDETTIRERGYRTLSDVLRDLPGVYIWKVTEGRDLASFRGILGADNSRFLLLVDGMPWYDGVYHHAWIDEYIPLHHIAQIEVLKGPGSAIYGTNAFAGVVNVVLRDAAHLQGARARVQAGTVGRYDVGVQAGGTARLGSLEANATGYARVLDMWGDGLDVGPDGLRNYRGSDPKRGVAVGTRFQLEGLDVQAHHVFYSHTFLANDATDILEALGQDLDTFGLRYHDTSMSARYRLEVGRDVAFTPHVWSQHHDNPGSYFYGSTWDTTEDDGSYTTEWQTTLVETAKNTTRWGGGMDFEGRWGLDHVTVAGAGVESVEVVELRDIAYTGLDGNPQTSDFQAPAGSALRNLYAYAQHTWTILPELQLTAGARLDKRIPAGSEDDPNAAAFNVFVSPRAGLLIAPNDRVTAKLLYGRAMRQGTVRELLVEAPYDEDSGLYQFTNGSLDVEPEGIHTVEAEVQVEPIDVLQARLAGSYSVVENEIDRINPPRQYQNLDGVLSVVGLEAEVNATVGPVRLRGAYALTLARYSDDSTWSGRQQYEFPPHMFKGNATLDIMDGISTTLTGEVYSSRPRSDWSPLAGMEDGAPFGLLHASVRAAKLGKADNVEVDLGVRNLLYSDWSTGVYRDEANVMDGDELAYPNGFEGEGRQLYVTIEVAM